MSGRRPTKLQPLTLLDCLDDPQLFGRAFQPGESWAAWRAFLAVLFGLPMTEAEFAIYRRHTGRERPPQAQAREAWAVCGRRAGKSRIAAAVAVFLAAFRDYAGVLATGELGTVMLLASDRRQARVLMRYVTGLLELPLLARLVVHRTAESITLSNHIVIEVHTASYRSVRGYTVVAAMLDEVAFWRAEDAANPDVEILTALRPAMATVAGALLLCISSPYARRGVLWEAYRRHHGQDGDPVLVWHADTRAMNPTVDERVIAEAHEQDEAAARAEYGAEFRRDLEDYVAHEAVAACVARDRRELPPSLHARHVAFCDPSGGSSDSMTLAVSHLDPQTGKAVLDVALEVRAPFSPDEVVQRFVDLLERYHVRKVLGDRYAGAWPADRFRAHRITYEPSEQTKSQLYGELLPLLTSGSVELLDDRRLVSQLLSLERRTSWGGRDTIDHPPNAHDDLANAVAGALVLAWAGRRVGRLPTSFFERPTITDVIPGAPAPPLPSPRRGIRRVEF